MVTPGASAIWGSRLIAYVTWHSPRRRHAPSLTLAGASAGGPVIGALLARRDLADRVRSVLVIDGLYSGEGAFAAWLDGATAGAPRRFVSVHRGGRFTQPHVDAMSAMLRARGVDFVARPRGALGDAVRGHAAVFATAACERVGMTAAVYDEVVGARGRTPCG